jgi:heme-degrading monooxygenase HmoA
MIARLWHGYANTRAHADAYEAMLKPELLPGVSTKKGYRGSHLLRRDVGDEIEFITILFFDSLADIKALTGPDFETAVIPAERRQHLSRFDAKATHYEVPATHGITHAG